MIDHLNNLPSEETPPKAGAMINTFRAFGYNLQTAIADIVDNSISAHAQNVWINYTWAGEDSWVTITDDGIGMNKDELVVAMTPGSKDPKDEREEHDLGRFGLGLKTSSFSQCKALTVLSKKKDHHVIKRHWDLDYVNETGKWNLLDYLSKEDLSNELARLESGTTVLWEKLDRLVGSANVHNDAARAVFLEEFERVETHLSLVFHRYIEKKKLAITVNDFPLEPWDPFMKGYEGSQVIANEALGKERINVKCYTLPHISKLSLEDRKNAKIDSWYDLQGFYVYRNDRLLLHGNWLGLFGKNEHYKNARILIDIPNKLDHEWKIDIKKATATPPVSIRKDLVRLGKLSRKSAGAVHRFRGNQIMLDDSIKSFDFQPVWKARKDRDEIRHYYVNEEHSILSALLAKDTISNKELKSILKLVSQSIPVEAIIQNQSEEPMSHELRSTNGDIDSGLFQLAKEMYKTLTSTGMDREMAIKQIFNIQPYNEYPQLHELLR